MRMTASIAMMCSLGFLAGPVSAAGGDAARGQAKSSICAACHGVTGISHQDIWPNLAAQRASYIVNQLKAYQSGTRKDTVMEAVAKILTEQEIADLAAYFEQQAASPPQTLGATATSVTHETHQPD